MAEQGFRKWIIVITVISAAIIELIDTSIVNVALTNMSASLGATIEDIAWVITAYAIANVIIIPMTSFLAGYFGRRKYYIGSILLFTTASFFCGNAHTLWELVAFRFLQGIGGGALLSTSQAILFEAFTMEERPLAAGIFSLGIVIGPTIGPTLGGWIVDSYNWRWIFYVNLPIGLVAALLSYLYVREATDRRVIKKVDTAGILLLIIGIASLQYVLERGQAEDWFQATHIIVLTATCIISLVLFIWHELTTEHPVVDLSVLTRSSTLAVAGILTFVLGFGLFSSVFIVPVFAQRLMGLDAMQTGLMLLPGALTAAILLPIVGRLMQKGFPVKPMILGGFILTALYTWMLSKVNLSIGTDNFFLPLILRGVGLAMISVPLTTLALWGLHGRDVAQGAALNNMMRQFGGSFGIAIINTYLAHEYARNRTGLVTHISMYDPATRMRLHALMGAFQRKGASLEVAKERALTVLDGIVTRQMLLKSYLDVFVFVTIFFVVCIPLIILVRQKKNAPKVTKEDLAMAH